LFTFSKKNLKSILFLKMDFNVKKLVKDAGTAFNRVVQVIMTDY